MIMYNKFNEREMREKIKTLNFVSSGMLDFRLILTIGRSVFNSFSFYFNRFADLAESLIQTCIKYHLKKDSHFISFYIFIKIWLWKFPPFNDKTYQNLRITRI